MHGNNNESSVATICEKPHSPSSHRLAQFTDSSQPVVAGGAQHGERVADSPQPPADQGQYTNDGQAYMAGFRSPGGGPPRYDSKSGETKQLATMGQKSDNRRQPLHSQRQAAVVKIAAPQGTVCVDTVLRLLEYQQYRCALTGRRLTPQTAALDHIVPVRFGGEHLIENTQVLHKDVNRAKGSLTSDEFIAMCHEVVRWSGSSTSRKDLQ